MAHKTNGCLNCEERHVGCHGSCERYNAWKKEQELVNGTGDKGVEEARHLLRLRHADRAPQHEKGRKEST